MLDITQIPHHERISNLPGKTDLLELYKPPIQSVSQSELGSHQVTGASDAMVSRCVGGWSEDSVWCLVLGMMHYSNVLQAALSRGHNKIVKVLVSKGANL